MHDVERLNLAIARTKDHTRSRNEHFADTVEIIQIVNSGILNREEALKALQAIPEEVYRAWRVR